MVSIVLDYLRAGESREEILRQYPMLKSPDVDAALGYAAWLAHEEDVNSRRHRGNRVSEIG